MSHGPSFFEGTEKKVELIVDRSLPSLRERGEAYWVEIVRAARAEILSSISNAVCDAYLLSESSLFVFDHKLLMITCGRTTLHDAMVRLLDDVPSDLVRMFVYERKNEVFPHHQRTSFREDALALHARLPGRAYQFGDEDGHHVMLFHHERQFEGEDDDGTLELLMHGLDDSVLSILNGEAARSAERIREATGLVELFDGFVLDDHAFTPTGYSLNGIRDDRYVTVHVTPERAGSYASFETNAWRGAAIEPLLDGMLAIFRPRSYDVVLIDPEPHMPVERPAYRVKTHVTADLEIGYGMRFLHCYRPLPERAPVRVPLG